MEGVDFFATAKKDQGSVVRRSQMFFQKILPCVANTTPSVFDRHPFLREGEFCPSSACQHYPVGLRPPPLLREGEFCPSSACQHYPAPLRLHPFYKQGEFYTEFCYRHQFIKKILHFSNFVFNII